MRRFPINYLPAIITYTFSFNGNPWASTATIFQAMQQVHLTLAWVPLCPHNFRITYFLSLQQTKHGHQAEVQTLGFSQDSTVCFSRLPLQKASSENCIKWWSSWQEAIALGLVIASVEEWASWASCMKYSALSFGMAMKWECYHKLSSFITGSCSTVTTANSIRTRSVMSLRQVVQGRIYAKELYAGA